MFLYVYISKIAGTAFEALSFPIFLEIRAKRRGAGNSRLLGRVAL
jgi:hypothetical protein